MGQVTEPRGAGIVPAAVLQKEWLCLYIHTLPATMSPIKRAPLSGAKEAQYPGAGGGHAGFYLGGNPNGKVGQLLFSLHPKL